MARATVPLERHSVRMRPCSMEQNQCTKASCRGVGLTLGGVFIAGLVLNASLPEKLASEKHALRCLHHQAPWRRCVAALKRCASRRPGKRPAAITRQGARTLSGAQGIAPRPTSPAPAFAEVARVISYRSCEASHWHRWEGVRRQVVIGEHEAALQQLFPGEPNGGGLQAAPILERARHYA